MLIEVCAATPESIVAAVSGGAGRIELCSALELGGLTPSAGLMRQAAGCGLPVFAMIRPRAGDFCWSAAELDLMCDDIATARTSGMAGVVLGASHPDGRLHRAALARLVSAADGMGLTLHRCFDLTPDRAEAVEMAVALGFHRILTSGHALRAEDGLAALAEVQSLAAGRLSIMAGSGVTAANAARFTALGLRELHASCAAPRPAPAAAIAFGFTAPEIRETRADLVAALVRAAALTS